MKSRQNSPQPEIVRMSTLTLEAAGTGPPKLQFKEIYSPAMNGVSGPGGFGLIDHESQQHSPRRPNGVVNGNVNGNGIGNGNGNVNGALSNGESSPLTPLRSRSITNNTIPALTAASPRSADMSVFPRLSPVTAIPERTGAGPGPDPALQSPPWSSAVGRATTGKSGRVIERLQAENDRLKRELKLESLRREEEQRKGEMARSKMESLQATNDNLVQMREADLTSQARRDRKMEEMRADLEAERTRRQDADGQLRALMRQGEAMERELRSQARDEAERARRATSQYEVLSSSWKQLDEGYRRKTERLKRVLTRLGEETLEERAKLERLEITVEQQRQEVEKMRAAKDAVASQFEAFRTLADESTRSMRETAAANDAASDKALEETLKVLGEMRHVINLKKYVRGTE
ncbi:MAG: hypothetical protein M1832_002064 [Thelocarpon impressellum]|nr:MAG: hypothetical protein M1832_002064 [Thelocarpon impressellum]